MATKKESSEVRIADDKADPTPDINAEVEREVARRMALLEGRAEALNVARDSDAQGERARTTRANEQREATPVRPVHDYQDEIEPNTLLGTTHIPARPGMSQRWIRTTAAGIDDPNNVARKWNQGWRPRAADSVPEGHAVPTITDRRYGNVIGIEGNILMEIPTEQLRRRRLAIEAQTRAQMEAADNDPFSDTRPVRGFGRPTRVEQGHQTRTGRNALRVADD